MPNSPRGVAKFFEATTSGNRLALTGSFDITQFRRVLGLIPELILDRGYLDIQLDFTECTFTHAPAMLGLATAIEHYQDRKIDFELFLPRDEILNRLFRNSNWAHIIEPRKYPLSEFSSLVHMPALRFQNPEQQHRLVNDTLNKILSSISGFTRSHFKAIEWSLNEITDNVLVHSDSPRGGLIQLTAMKGAKRIEFVVGDSGIGIPKSLRSSGNMVGSDVDTLASAIKQGVTRDKSIGQGNGLYGSYQISIKSGANFGLHSGNATLYYTPRTGMHTKLDKIPVLGTIVVCGIDYTQPLLLEEALNIRTKRFSPVDMIELKYESTDDGNIFFDLIEEAKSFGSRTAGTPVRNRLKNLIGFLESRQKIVIDLDGINLVSSSFADEVFGKLFVELGPLEFSAKIEIKNVDPIVKVLIDKAIFQRMSA